MDRRHSCFQGQEGLDTLDTWIYEKEKGIGKHQRWISLSRNRQAAWCCSWQWDLMTLGLSCRIVTRDQFNLTTCNGVIFGYVHVFAATLIF